MLVLRTASALAVAALVLGFPFLAETYPQGAPAGFAGDTIDPFAGIITCAVDGCHNSYGLDSGSGSVSIQAPSVVAPGETVAITVTVVNTTPPADGSIIRQGFQATVRTPEPNGPYVGALAITDPVNTRTPFGSVSYITHTEVGTTQTSWTFNWTAPATDAPPTVLVFAAGNAANGGDLPAEPGNSAAGDYIYTATASIGIDPLASEGAPDETGLHLGRVGPNPATAQSHVMLTLAEPAAVSVRIVDGRGRTVRLQPERALPAGTTALRLDARGLAPGTYFVTAGTARGSRSQAFRVAQ
jgi:hypothetical protein